ncbi:sensor histidine kinase [Pseudoxanthomonas wuyuanensis]
MRRHSLRQALARRWMLFTAVLWLLFVAAGLLLLFVLEDSFIDRRLHAVAATVIDPQAPPASLPSQFQVASMAALPDDIRAELGGDRIGRLVEFRRANGRYVHVLATRTTAGHPFALIYDVTDELTVNQGLTRGLASVALLLAVLMLCAYLLSRAFVGRMVRRAQALLRQVLDSPDPEALEALAQQEPVREFGDLARLHARVWRAQLAAVDRERETLAFLGHELRTPLQSARTSLSLLAGDPGHAAALSRLQRAVERLARASSAILWLASDHPGAADGDTQAAACLQALAEELGPMAAARGQAFELTIDPELRWARPQEIVETVLANLLLNAIQHGGPGTITITADAGGLFLHNPRAAAEAAGFGLGMRIVGRLAARIGWQVSFSREADGALFVARWDASSLHS